MQDSLPDDIPEDDDDALAGAAAPSAPFVLPPLVMTEEQEGDRLDKALAWLVPPGLGLSRSRLQALIAEGAVSRAGPGGAPGEPVTNHKGRVKAGEAYCVVPPPPAPAEPAAEDIPLSVLYEDGHLIVVDKPAGMVVHPAPGAESGTLVNALLHHCRDLSGIGGQARPGIVHRIDKDTSGILVVAKTDAAHQRLSQMFAAHDLDRQYMAITWGAPDVGDPRIRGIEGVEIEPGGIIAMETQIGRHPSDRKRQAVLQSGGRRALTRFRTMERFGPMEKPVAGLVACALETGRTHQIRVHLSHAGHPLVGDAAYARGGRRASGVMGEDVRAALDGFRRQALHAAVLGFEHPVTGEALEFETPPPADMSGLLDLLRG